MIFPPSHPHTQPGIQLEGEEEEPEEETTLGSRLMSLLEKVRLVKKKEEKPEEEPPAEESKPREDCGGPGAGRGRAWGASVCSVGLGCEEEGRPGWAGERDSSGGNSQGLGASHTCGFSKGLHSVLDQSGVQPASCMAVVSVSPGLFWFLMALGLK